MSKSGTSAKKRKGAGGKKGNASWMEEDIPVEKDGEKMYYSEHCLKWLKSQMDGSSSSNGNGNSPYRHHHADVSASSSSSAICLIDRSYEYFPLSNNIALKCIFCDQCFQSGQECNYWKNPYVRRSWLPVCSDCARPNYLPPSLTQLPNQQNKISIDKQ